MYKQILMAVSCIAIGLSAGCNNAKSPDAVNSDVAAAKQKADANVADARKDAAKDTSTAMQKVDEKSKDVSNAEAKGAYDVAVAKAEGDHKVALEKCNVLSGDAQKNCKNMADADYDAAKAKNKSTEMARKQ